MPAKHLNGNGHCRIHSHAATACRVCLVQGLQEFRHANVRAGIHLATERISALREDYLSRSGRQLTKDDVTIAMNRLLTELREAEKQVGEMPVDVGIVLRASRQASGHGVRC